MPKPPHNVITIYGRKPVLEALQQPNLTIFRVHLADSNKAGEIVREIESICEKRKIECRYHDRLALSRISKNRKQDQGVAADIVNPQALELNEYLASHTKNARLIAVDNITNPQNLGMIIRSVAASNMDGLLLPKRGCAKLDSLVVKASAGSLFRCKLVFCEELADALHSAKAAGFSIYGMAIEKGQPINSITLQSPSITVVGNESEGLSKAVRSQCDVLVYIPMHNGVESLNVSVAAGILAFMDVLQ